MNIDEAVRRLEELSDPESVAGMARYGINPENTLGVSIPKLRRLAREAGKDHALALDLWSTGIHEARILAGMVDEASAVAEGQMDAWAEEFDSWDVCDQVCMNLFWLTPYAYDKCYQWSSAEKEFGKRAGFALMARLAWSDKDASDEKIAGFLAPIEREATDERNYVKKAVNWALRQVGKRNLNLNGLAIGCAKRIAGMDSKTARWVAADALKELESEAVQRRLGAR